MVSAGESGRGRDRGRRGGLANASEPIAVKLKRRDRQGCTGRGEAVMRSRSRDDGHGDPGSRMPHTVLDDRSETGWQW